MSLAPDNPTPELTAAGSTALATVVGRPSALAGSRTDQLKAYFSRLLDDADEVRALHVEGHLQRAQFDDAEALERVQDKPTEFAEWITGVADVDPDDKELSLIWHAALKALSMEGTNRKIVMDIAKKMSVDEAAAFIALMNRYWGGTERARALYRRVRDIGFRRLGPRGDPLDEDYHLRRLRERGLVKNMWAGLTGSMSGRLFAVGAVFSFIVAAAEWIPAMPRAAGALFGGILLTASPTEAVLGFYVPIFGLMGVLCLPLFAVRWLRIPVLTPTGEMFCDAVRSSLALAQDRAAGQPSDPPRSEGG